MTPAIGYRTSQHVSIASPGVSCKFNGSLSPFLSLFKEGNTLDLINNHAPPPPPRRLEVGSALHQAEASCGQPWHEPGNPQRGFMRPSHLHCVASSQGLPATKTHGGEDGAVERSGARGGETLSLSVFRNLGGASGAVPEPSCREEEARPNP